MYIVQYAKRTSCLSLGLGLAVVFPVLDCISYSCARNRSRLSLWLGLVVDILQFWKVYRTVRKKDFVFIARVRVSQFQFWIVSCVLGLGLGSGLG